MGPDGQKKPDGRTHGQGQNYIPPISCRGITIIGLDLISKIFECMDFVFSNSVDPDQLASPV